MKDYLLRLPQELHLKVKMLSVLKQTSMAQFIIEAIEEKLEKEGK